MTEKIEVSKENIETLEKMFGRGLVISHLFAEGNDTNIVATTKSIVFFKFKCAEYHNDNGKTILNITLEST